MAKNPDVSKLSQGLSDERTKNAVGQLERLVQALLQRITDLEDRVKALEP